MNFNSPKVEAGNQKMIYFILYLFFCLLYSMNCVEQLNSSFINLSNNYVINKFNLNNNKTEIINFENQNLTTLLNRPNLNQSDQLLSSSVSSTINSLSELDDFDNLFDNNKNLNDQNLDLKSNQSESLFNSNQDLNKNLKKNHNDKNENIKSKNKEEEEEKEDEEEEELEELDEKYENEISKNFLSNNLKSNKINHKFKREKESLIKLQKFILNTVENMLKSTLPVIVRASSETNISTSCSSSFLTLARSLQANKQWAFKMLDSSGKPPSGILEGTLTDLGSFEQCLSIDTLNGQSENNINFNGKYCIMDIKPDFDHNLPIGSQPPTEISNNSVLWNEALQLFWSRNNLLSFRYGLCVPSVCTKQDLQVLTQYFFEPTGMVCDINNCQLTAEQNIDTLQIFIITCLSLIFIIVLVATLLETSLHKIDKKQLISTNKKCLVDFLICFSLIKNSRKVFAEDKNNSKINRFKHLNGVRFFSTCWIMIGHTYFYTDFVHYHHFRNLAKFKYLDDNFWFMPIANFTLSVETYFFISGFLVVYTNWQKLVTSKGILNPFDFIIHRAWRILPSYLVTIACILILPLFGSGPLWPQAVLSSANKCRKNWWYNVLFINNFQKPDDVCMFHTWFLSVNIQFYLITIPLLYLLYKYPKTCFIIFSFSILMCTVSVFYYTQTNNLDIPATIADDIFVDFDNKILTLYIMPYYHLPSYIIGMVFGYFMIKNKNITFSCTTRYIFWTLCSIGMCLVIFLPYQSFQGKPTSLTFSSLYLSTHRIVWSLAFGWIVLACSNGYGKLINCFLSSEFFRPLGLLSYLAYLIHPVLMVYHTGIVRERVNLTHYQLVNTFLSRVVLAFVSAYLLYITIEVPFANIEKYLFPRNFKNKSSNLTISNNEENKNQTRSSTSESSNHSPSFVQSTSKINSRTSSTLNQPKFYNHKIPNTYSNHLTYLPETNRILTNNHEQRKIFTYKNQIPYYHCFYGLNSNQLEVNYELINGQYKSRNNDLNFLNRHSINTQSNSNKKQKTKESLI